jgi:hypothetical protein
MSDALYAGFAQIEITPLFAYDDPKIQVFDPLYARILLLRQGDSSAALITADLFTVESSFDAKLGARLAGIPWLDPANLFVCPSHAGFSPVFKGGYIHIFNERFVDQTMEDYGVERVTQAIAEAAANMSAVRVGFGSGQAPDVLYNRRTLTPDGQLVMTFTLPAARPDLTFGPANAEVAVVRFDTTDGQQKGALVVFGCHALCSTDRYGHVTADYPRYVVDVFDQVAGIPALFAMGTLGNMVPIQRQGLASRRIGRSVGCMALYEFEQIQPQADLPLRVAHRTTTLPLRPLPTLSEARQAYAANPNHGPTRHNLFLAEQYQEQQAIPYMMRAILLGDAVLLHLPGEIFVQTGFAIKQASPFAQTIIISRATGEVGYVPTPEDQQLGGMEPDLTALDVEGEAVLRQEAIAFLRDLASR